MRFYQLLEASQSGGGRSGGGGGVGGGAHADTRAHLRGVQVVIDQAVDDLGEVVLDDGVTDLLQRRVKREQGAELNRRNVHEQQEFHNSPPRRS